MSTTPTKPAPKEIKLGEQVDDNIDDLGRKNDGSKQEQPETSKPVKPSKSDS